jgi:hypothetical protein
MEMHRIPPTTKPLNRNSRDEAFVWILAGERERERERQGASDAHEPTDVLQSELERSASPSRELPIASIVR